MSENEEKRKNYASAELIKIMNDLGGQYQIKMKEASEIDGELRILVNKHLDDHDLWNNTDAIKEMIDNLSAGSYLRFNLYETLYELLEKQGNEEII